MRAAGRIRDSRIFGGKIRLCLRVDGYSAIFLETGLNTCGKGTQNLGLLARPARDEELDGFGLLEAGDEGVFVIGTEVLARNAGFLRVELVRHGRRFPHEVAGGPLVRKVLGDGRRVLGAQDDEREGNLVVDGIGGIVVGKAGGEAGSRAEQPGGQGGQEALAGLAVMVDVGVAEIGAKMRHDAVARLEARFFGVGRLPRVFLGVFREHHGYEVGRGAVRALVEVRGHGAAHHVADEVDEIAEGVGHRVFASGGAGAGVELQLVNDGSADEEHGHGGGGGGRRAAPRGDGIGHGFHRGDEQRHVFGLGSGHDAEGGDKLDGQHALTGRHDPKDFGGIALGALEHGRHLVHGGRDDGQAEGPLALLEHVVHIGVGAGELEPLGGIGLDLGVLLFLGRGPGGGRLHDVVKRRVDLGVDFFLGDHAQRMGDRHKAHVGEALALLGAARKGQEGVGNDGDSGNAGLFKIGLVNYQP